MLLMTCVITDRETVILVSELWHTWPTEQRGKGRLEDVQLTNSTNFKLSRL